MTCARYRQFLSRYLDGEVTPRQRRELLEHVEGCRECAAWLARARQTDVLLKGGTPEARPSDRVRDAILSSVKHQPLAPVSHFRVQSPESKVDLLPTQHSAFRRWSLLAAGLLLRFDPSPKRVALAAATSIFAIVALAYWLNLLPPLGGYKELGFLVPREEAPAAVNATPLAAISSGEYGVGGPVAVPNPVRLLPAKDARQVSLGAPLSIRFDQPMDRASVEDAWLLDPPAAGKFNWEADNEIRFSPHDPGLLRGITYTVQLTGTARSLTGTPLRQPISWSFRTREPYGVEPGVKAGTILPPTGTLSLNFEAPMNREQTIVSLHAADTGAEVPATLQWGLDGRTVTLSPDLPMPEGTVHLRVGAMSRTQEGDTLGQPHELVYTVVQPAMGLHLLDGRVKLTYVGRGDLVPFSVEAGPVATATQPPMKAHIPDEDAHFGPIVTFSLYNLPAERISELEAQVKPWPAALPPGLTASLAHVETFAATFAEANTDKGSVPLPETLAAGTYLLVATALADASDEGTLLDWQMLVVADSHLALMGEGDGALFWATDAKGRAWAESEVSLYSSAGRLIEKGLTDRRGLWSPDMPREGASLAIARDGAGHLAVMLLDPRPSPNLAVPPQGSLPATLRTDRAEYYPGQSANFRLLLSPATWDAPIADREVAVSLLTPGGNALSSLTLKSDDMGGVSGLFNLPSDLRPGEYTVMARSSGEERRFPLQVRQPSKNGLSVYIAPGPQEDETIRAHVMTRTISVLGQGGAPAAGATLTATLGITGDVWTSGPLTATTNSDGQATVVLPLPSWVAVYNDPSLYLNADVTLKDLAGSSRQYLDLTLTGVAQAGMGQMVSPALNLAAIASPTKNGSLNVRLVTLDELGASGDVLFLARSPSGEQEIWSLNLPGIGDLTVSLSRRYAGGRVSIWRAGVGGYREMLLMPSIRGGMEMQIDSPPTAMPNAPLTLFLGLVDKEGTSAEGTASVWFRRVAGDTGYVEGLGWEADVALSATGPVSATVQSPGAPGLWYVMSEAATTGGGRVLAWSVLRVLPGPYIQTPPNLQAQAGESQTLSVIVHNPSSQAVSSVVQLGGDDALRTLGGDSQNVSVAPGGNRRVSWSLLATRPGDHTALFSLMVSGELAGAWDSNVVASVGTRITTTHLSGVSPGERAVGVLVPSGLSPGGVELQVRASTSLLPTLSGITLDLVTDSPFPIEKAAAASARLSSSAVVAWAYDQTKETRPTGLLLTVSERARLLEQIYAAQHEDGSWSAEASSTGKGITGTAHVLIALRRYSLAWPDERHSQLPVDAGVIERGLAYLSAEVARDLGDRPTTAMLDERAYGLYTLSSYSLLQPEVARPYIAYTSSRKDVGLSIAGQAWLALALLQSGSTQDGLLLVSRLLESQGAVGPEAAAPLLEALWVADKVASQEESGYRRNAATYAGAAPLYVRLLMESRQGPGWATYGATADALWALSHYAAQTQSGEKALKSAPALALNDRPVQVPPGSDPSSASLIIPGREMHAGTNWLKLQPVAPGQVLYYSLTLKATR